MDNGVITQQNVDAILQRLDALAAKLGVTVQFIYDVYVRQARIAAITDTVWAVSLLVLAILAGLGVRPLFRYGIHKIDDDWPFVTGSLLAIVAVVFLLISGGCAHDAIMEWLNPQYWALTNLFKALHQ